MLRLSLYIIMLFCTSCAFAQKKNIHYEKDMGWAKWVFTSIEFNDDYTTVRGHFIPGKNGCSVSTEMTEVLMANGKEYRLLESTLPKENYLVKKAFPSGDTITFESKFEPIMSLDGTVSYKSKNIQFDIDNVCIDIKPDLYRKYSTYAKRMLAWKKSPLADKGLYLRYLSHCAEELSLMPKDSATLARSYLGNCYNAYEIFMNSYPGYILKNWKIIRDIHYGMTGKKLKKSEQKYLNNVAEFANEVTWKSKIMTANNLKLMRQKAEKVFRQSDKETELYKQVLWFLGDSKYSKIPSLDLKWARDARQRALERYNAGDYAEAYRLYPFDIQFKYKALPYENFKKYCDTLYTKNFSTLAVKVNVPNNIVLSYGGIHSDAWNFLEAEALLKTIPYFARETNDPEIIRHALNGLLNAKAFTYYADRYLKEHLSGSLNLYRKIQSESAALTMMYENGLSDEGVYQTAEEIKQLKRDLLERHRQDPIPTEGFLVEWDSVRNHLKPRELAVEFQDFPIWNTDSVCYIAITYKHDSPTPKLYTVLKDRKDALVNVVNKDHEGFNGNELSGKIWDAMKDEIASVDRIYFSPSGILHRLPLENSDTTRLYYRLTSTKELLHRNQDSGKLQNCVLYGGLEYGFKEVKGSSSSKDTKVPPMLSLRQMRDFTARGPLDDISEQSEAEVNTIASLLQKKGVEARVFRRQYGTEESFKALADTNVDAIHISTHGFYWEADRVTADENAADYSFLKLEDSKLPDNEKAMVRSALLFAGAQEAMEGGTKKQGVENGVLTAKEISMMTFPNLKLVVLSACQSGLGEVDATEGTLGLQRAFKTAGAKTILMTLREVDNHATRLFMEEFYRQYISGKNMVNALIEAQSFLRNYEEDGTTPYKDPKYWAYFTLLDALD